MLELPNAVECICIFVQNCFENCNYTYIFNFKLPKIQNMYLCGRLKSLKKRAVYRLCLYLLNFWKNITKNIKTCNNVRDHSLNDCCRLYLYVCSLWRTTYTTRCLTWVTSSGPLYRQCASVSPSPWSPATSRPVNCSLGDRFLEGQDKLVLCW